MKLKLLLEDGEFGNILFQDVEKWGRGEKEPDTPKERKFGIALTKFLKGSSMETKTEPGFLDAVYTLLRMKSDFPKELRVKRSNPLYRGVQLSDRRLINLGKKHLKDFSRSTVMGKTGYTLPLYYKPHSKIQSGTSDGETARNFGNAIVSAKVPSIDLLFNPEFMNDISNLVLGEKEGETIRIGGSIKTTVFLTKDVYDFIKRNST